MGLFKKIFGKKEIEAKVEEPVEEVKETKEETETVPEEASEVENVEEVIEKTPEETVEEEVVEEQEEEAVEEAAEEESEEEEEIPTKKEPKPAFIIDENGNKVYPGRTFLERIEEADPELVKMYSDLKNVFLSYRKVHTRVSKTNDAFRFEGKLIGKIIVAGKGLKVYLALDPMSVDSAIYHQRDASSKKNFAATPLVVKVKSPLSYRKAKVLIEKACEKFSVKKSRFAPKDWTKADTKDTEEIA